MRTKIEIENKIKEIENDRQDLLSDYIKCTDDIERDIMANVNTERLMRIRDLKWVLNV